MEYDSEDGYALITDENVEKMPSGKWGLTIAVPFTFGLLLASICFVVAIFRCSQKQEKNAAIKQKSERNKKDEQLKAGLSCKPWSTGLDDSGYTSATVEPVDSERLEKILTFGESSSEEDDEYDEEDLTPSPGTSPVKAVPKDESLDAFVRGNVECAVCSKPFVEGENIYTSNNPGCCHQHHKVCMDKWLEYQNTCPLCNQPFALKTA